MNDEFFDDALADFINYVQVLCDAKNREVFSTQEKRDQFKVTVSAMRGKRYVRIVKEDCAQRSVHCFVDTMSGSVLFANGWKGPAKNRARGSIYDPDNYGVTAHGAVYLR